MAMKINPYIVLNGNCNEAIKFYVEVFEAKVEMCDFIKNWPDEFDHEMLETYGDNVMHAQLTIGTESLMMADAFPGTEVLSGSSVTLMLSVKTKEEASQLFQALLVGGNEMIELQETNFSPALGQVRDQFGVEWQIIVEF